ncbi:MAG: hypothetical protein E4H03_05415 [Myxococcales bacterium]|jgi:hypothetical protein|nr:MAG: hypothetical protein E4H03_05415 [Myxococcales bacterium]
MTHPAGSLIRTTVLVLAVALALGVATRAAAATALSASSSRPQDGGGEGLQLAYELEQPANMGNGLSIPGDVNVVEEGGYDTPTGASDAPADQGHSGVVVGVPVGDSGRQGNEPGYDANGVAVGIVAERDSEMEARSGRPMGIDGPSDGQLDLETPSTRQMDLEAPSARQLDLETPSVRQQEIER